MAALIEVLPANDRGASTSRSPKLRAAAALPIAVQSTTTLCWPAVAHSTKHTAMRRLRAGGDGLHHVRMRDGGGSAFALKPEFGLGRRSARRRLRAPAAYRRVPQRARPARTNANTRPSSATTRLIAPLPSDRMTVRAERPTILPWRPASAPTRILALLPARAQQAADAGRPLHRHHRLGGRADLGGGHAELVVAAGRAVLRLLVPGSPISSSRRTSLPPFRRRSGR